MTYRKLIAIVMTAQETANCDLGWANVDQHTNMARGIHRDYYHFC